MCDRAAATPTSCATTASTTTGDAASCSSQVPDDIACDLDKPQQTCSPDAVRRAVQLAPQPVLRQHDGGRAGGRTRRIAPDGVDFRWGNQRATRTTAGTDNTGVDGTEASVTERARPAAFGLRDSLATGPVFQPELVACFLEEPTCTWTETPPGPAPAAATGSPEVTLRAITVGVGPMGRAIAGVLACCAAPGHRLRRRERRERPRLRRAGSPDVQTSTREADCTDWNAASVEDRQVIVASIAEFEGGAPTGTLGRTLPDDEAYDLFESALRAGVRERVQALQDLRARSSVPAGAAVAGAVADPRE